MFGRGILFVLILWFSANTSAAISYVTSSNTTGNDDKASLAVPTATVADDVLVVQVAIRDRSGSDGVTAPGGWSQIGTQIADGGVFQSLYYRVATSADAGSGISYEWDFDGNGNRRYILGMTVFRGIDTTNPIDQESSQTGMSGSSVTALSVTTSAVNAMLVGFYALEAGNQSFTPASGMLEAYDVEEHNNNNGITAMAAYEIQASAGASGDKVANATKSNDDAIGHLVALKEGSLLPLVSSTSGSCGTDNLIVVQYASATSDEALKVSNYTLSSGNITGVTRQDENTFVLATDGLVGGQAYTLTVQGNNHTVSFDGLMGRYYDQRNSSGNKVSYPGGLFTGSEFLRLDSQVNFSWGSGTPTVFPNISGNNERFSIRWTGYVAPALAGSYEFRLYSDDGVRLSFEGVEIVNDWNLHGPRYSSVSSPQTLSAGQTYEVQMEHFEHTGQAYAQLEWRRDGGSWENIPTANLSTCSIPAVTPLPPSALEFRMDETSWNGTADEVIDSSGNDNHATARGGLNTVDPGHLCRAGDFDGVDDYIESNEVYDLLKGTSSMSFWIKTTQTGDDTGWRAPGIAGIEESGGSDDIFWGWLDASGRIGLSVANDFTTKSTIPINDDVYHHIVLTRDATSGAYKIYIDGNLNNSGTLTTGIIGNSFSSIGQIEDTGGTPEYFQGDLDEVKVFGSVLSDKDVTALSNETRVCPPTSCTLDRFDIIQPTYGLACPNARAKITIKAICAGSSLPKEDYVGTIDLSSDENSQSEFYLIDSGGSAVNSVTLNSSNNGKVDVYLFHKNENADLKVTAEDTGLSISSTASNGTGFRTSGFKVDRPTDFDFACGGSNTFTITAVGQNNPGSGSCNTLTGFTGSKSLKAWADVSIEPSSPNTKNTGLPKSILFNGSPVAETSVTSNNVAASFSAGVATVTVEYLDVGNVIDLSFVHNDSPYDGATSPFSPLGGSAGTFVIKPDSVQIEADDMDASCSPLSATCSRFRKAGLPFSTTARAVCLAPNNVTAPSYRGAVDIDHQLVLPIPSAGNKGNLAVGTIVFDGTSNILGEEIEANQKISEVGIFSLKTKPPTYFGELINEYDSDPIGRFYPHHFDVTVSGGAFDNECSATFTYMDQPFQFGAGTAPEITITAENADNDRTLNYEGDFWKLGSNLAKTSSCNGGTGTIKGFCYEDAVLGNALFQPTVLSQSYPNTVNAKGEIVFDLHDGVATSAEFEYSRPLTAGSRVSPFDADVKLTIDLEDSDTVQGSVVKEYIGFVGDSDSGVPLNTTNDQYLRYGRWVLENAFGPETSPLKIPMSAEYYDGANFVTNTDDDCSSYNAVNMKVAPDLKNSGTTTATGSGVAVLGQAQLSSQIELSAPGIGKEGIAELCLDVEMWLKFDWNNNGLDLGQICDASSTPTMGDNDNPMSTATFGRYRGHDRIIYWREVSN